MTQTCRSCRWWVSIESSPMGACHLDPFTMRYTGEAAACPQFETSHRPVPVGETTKPDDPAERSMRQ